ncbi:MAG: glutamate--tRNA ligase [Thermodesulfobacteriota bacterium]|nr:glutamate--tRNA ligase [Thermodesulfobacteriota bacterium]
MSDIRTRFAPSPTGYLHVGGARTALFNWLFARHFNGKFILRIEDTDRIRSTEESIRAIYDGMEWLGLDWDEGPYLQTERFRIYKEYIEKLLEQEKAYYCCCTPDELERKRKLALAEGRKPKYDGKCRELNVRKSDKPCVVRFKTPEEGFTTVDDHIKGEVKFENLELDDLIVQRSDGSPTYNFTVVVDDITMGITHIIRGDDHLNNTPKQILLYRALNSSIPRFAHVPLILGTDKTRLSKRHGATSVMAYKDMGYLPQAVMNYLVRLGWSSGDQEIFSKDELIEKFSLDNVGKSAGIFNSEKLLWLNSHYIKEEYIGYLTNLLIPFLQKKGYEVENNELLQKIVFVLKERSKTLVEMADSSEFFFKEKIDYDRKAAEKFLKPELGEIFKIFIKKLGQLETFTQEVIEKIFRDVSSEKSMKLGKIAQPVRVALTGSTASPGLFEVMEILGREKVLLRLENAIDFIATLEGTKNRRS